LQPHVVLMDLRMPIGDGATAIAQIKLIILQSISWC
jgi:CheY-like chemotaxis protein